MSNNPADLQRQLEELKAENKRLREFNDLLRAQRKELMDQVCGPLDKYAPTDEEIAAGLKTAVPLAKVFEELGITRPPTSTQ